MLLKIEIAFIALACLALLAKPFEPHGRLGNLLDVVSIVAAPAAICTIVLGMEMSWIDRTHHSISQTIDLINRGRAEHAQPIWLDDVISSLSQRRMLIPYEFATLLLAGGSVGFRLGKAQSDRAARTPSSTSAASEA